MFLKESKVNIGDEKPPKHQEEKKSQDHIVPETQEKHDVHQAEQQSSDINEGVDFSVVQNRDDDKSDLSAVLMKEDIKPNVVDKVKPKNKVKTKKIQPKLTKKV